MIETIQISQWLLVPDASNLPVLAMILGLELMFFGVVTMGIEDIPIVDAMPSRERRVVTASLAMGFLFAALSLLQSNLDLYAVYLFLLFRTIEGAAAVRFYQKVAHIIVTQSLPTSNRFKKKAKHLLLVFAIVAGGFGVALNIIANASGRTFPWYQLAVVYTIVSFLLAVLGVRWRLQLISDDINTPLIIGLALCIGGAEIFNFGSIFTEIAVISTGSITYQAGFWAAVLLTGINTILPATTTANDTICGSCGEDLSKFQSPAYCPNCGHNTG